MAARLLAELLDRNEAHIASLPPDAFGACRDAQHPPIVSVCCSDSRVSQEGMWRCDAPDFLFTAGNIGNRVRAVVDGEFVLDGSVAYPLGHADTDVLAIVGHTGCGAVGAALEAVRTGTYPSEPGVRADVEELVPVVEAGLNEPYIREADENGSDSDDAGSNGTNSVSVHNQLVEYNVHDQVAFACETDEASGSDVYGFVYDFHGQYGDRDGAVYLVNVTGERDVEEIRSMVSDEHADHVRTLL